MHINVATNKIIQISNLIEFEKTLKTANDKTLVVFDIDEVIFTSQDQVLHPNYKQHLDIFVADIEKNYGIPEVRKFFAIMNRARKKEIIDNALFKIFEYLQAEKIMTLALTHWPTGEMVDGGRFEHLRIQQLQEFGIDFHRLSPHSGDINLAEIQNERGSPILHKGVILTTGLIEKGLVLEQILSKINFKPNKIIFIDDLIENIISVESMCKKIGSEFIGFEYTAAKGTSSGEFNYKRAKLQFEVLSKEKIWLSDREADSRLI